MNDATSGDRELPSYSVLRDGAARPATNPLMRTKHTYSLTTAKGKKWLSLNLSSRAVSSETLPVFRDGDEISGEVTIDLDKPQSCKGVVIGIIAETTAVGQEPAPFVELSSVLWSPPSSSSKLSGTLTWPFTLTLPKEALIAAAPKHPLKSYPLPPTFSERASPAYIDYKVIVTVRRGAFRVNQVLSTSFAFVPRSVASPPSSMRIAAYHDGSPLTGPEGDPEGWKTLPPVKVTGTLFDTKSVEIEVTLALATPLEYAVGSPIPLVLSLKCLDTQALDLLAQPSSQSVFLTRTIAVGSTATDDSAPRRSDNTFPEHLTRAYWWSSEESSSSDTRVLHGEIEVGKALKPGFVFPRLSIRYHISLFPSSSAGFVSSMPTDTLLLSSSISIVTENAPGIIPRSHAPPGYIKPAEGNYNNSMGYLENGNQRFYHHHGQ